MTKLTSKPLFDLFNLAQTQVQKWNASEGTATEFEGQGGYKTISRPLSLAFMRLIDASADQGVEVADLQTKRVVMALDEFGPLFASWLRRFAVQAANPSGESALWDAWARVVEAFVPLVDKFERPVKYLVEVANAPRDQIARMYGWVDAEGNPDISKVDEEYENPGTHFNKDTWQSPAMKSRRAQIEGQWEARKMPRSILFDPNDLLDAASKPKGEPVPPPSKEALLEADAPAEQIARLLGMSVDDAQYMKMEYEEKNAAKAVS